METQNVVPVILGGLGRPPIGRMWLQLTLVAVLLALVCGVISNQTASKLDILPRFTSEVFNAFDTPITIIGHASSEAEFSRLASLAQERYLKLHMLFDIYNSYPGLTNLKDINDQAGGEALRVDPDILSLLSLAKEGYLISGGLVDITLGPVLEIWHVLRVQALAGLDVSLPSNSELGAALALRGIRDVELDFAAQTVRLAREGMSLNVGAVAKGYATEQVVNLLCSEGFEAGLIDAGGHIRVIGQPMDGQRTKWGVGIQDPEKYAWISGSPEERMLDAVFVADTSVVSSGDYQRYFYVEDQRYHHIIDPRTGYPATQYQAVTVEYRDSGWADLLSTAVFLLSPDEALAVAEEHGFALYLLPQEGPAITNSAMQSILQSEGATARDP